MRPFDIFERPCIKPLRDDLYEHVLSVRIRLPTWMVSLEDWSHRQTIFCHSERAIQYRFKLC